VPRIDSAGRKDNVGGVDRSAAVFIVGEGGLRVRRPSVEAFVAKGSIKVQTERGPRMERLFLVVL